MSKSFKLTGEVVYQISSGVSVGTQLTFTCSKSTIKTLVKSVKYVHSQQ